MFYGRIITHIVVGRVCMITHITVFRDTLSK